MSRFRHALAERDNHILTLRAVIVLLCLCLAGVGYGWYSAPQKLTLWFPPDLRSGSTRPWWEVPPVSVYAFTFYIFQQLNRWPDNGEEDYSRNLRFAARLPDARLLHPAGARFSGTTQWR